ncbi:undecaprenyl-diphosphatase [Streptomyces sp. SFB5A]|uniref:Undecaprenyl-diphosphatase n=1 Tax=Streptomyces nymphaeiformis TaxID=2663842 RepID=A0A7W7U3I4_9ACTN|nr:undecaprenyl-diphosphatase [Streptomyces nymphaeiformis]
MREPILPAPERPDHPARGTTELPGGTGPSTAEATTPAGPPGADRRPPPAPTGTPDGRPPSAPAGPPGADRRLLAVLRSCGHRPGVALAARGLSRSGEHGALWLGAGLLAAAVDRPRRDRWLRGTALIAGAHLASMGVKRLVRRPRPAPETYEPLVRTAGRHSFPSSHATSAAAAVVVFGALHPTAGRLAAPAALAMCLSRLVVGVHYPSDVAAGALLGAATAAAGRSLLARAEAGR